jgi:uncharacterized protein (DUF885 family)
VTGELSDIITGYLDLRWRIHPVDATHAGRHELDGTYADYSPAALREHTAALRSYTGALEEALADSLDDEIDRTAALHDARHLLLVLERERPFAFNPAFHLSHALNGIHLLIIRNAQDPPRRAAALLDRLRALPGFLRRAVEVLAEPARPLVDMASDMIPGGLALLREGVEDPSVDLSSLDPVELESARDGAVDALLEFAGALAEMDERARDSYAIGRELFDRKLHTAHMIRESADELLRYGERLCAEMTARVGALAAEIQPGAHWRDVVERLREETPSREAAIPTYGDALRATRDFTITHALMTVPDDDVRVTPTPRFLRAMVPFAAYQAPGAFDEAQCGTLYVTLPDDRDPWRMTCRAELPSIVLHEGVPGHHQQIVTANRLPRIVRRVLATPATQEGWALYCESLMGEAGFFTSPAERLFQAQHLLWRALRVVLDVSLHTRGMTVETAARRLQDELGFSEASARAEAARYCAYPTYQLCYAVGRREILRLREDARRARVSSFSLPAFHDELLGYGALPTALARWGMGLS